MKTWELVVAVLGVGLYCGWIMMWESFRIADWARTAARIEAIREAPRIWEDWSDERIDAALRHARSMARPWAEPWDAATTIRILGGGLLAIVPPVCLLHSAGRMLAARSRGAR
jgi:hypothetical protein